MTRIACLLAETRSSSRRAHCSRSRSPIRLASKMRRRLHLSRCGGARRASSEPSPSSARGSGTPPSRPASDPGGLRGRELPRPPWPPPGSAKASRRRAGGRCRRAGPGAASLLPLPRSSPPVSSAGGPHLGELAALPTAGSSSGPGRGRAGPAAGPREDPARSRSWRPGPTFEESVECEWGIETLEPGGGALGRLAAQLCGRLGARGLAADGFEWVCRLADGARARGARSPPRCR